MNFSLTLFITLYKYQFWWFPEAPVCRCARILFTVLRLLEIRMCLILKIYFFILYNNVGDVVMLWFCVISLRVIRTALLDQRV